MPSVTARYREWAPRMMRDLMRDFGFADFQAAGIVGNGGGESGGFETMQELRPTVAGSRGGLGAFQWTASRRIAFEDWLRRNAHKGWTAHTYESNYSMLFRELKGPEAKTVPAVKATKTIEDATYVFCKVFERPGIPHVEGRIWWAKQALLLYHQTAPGPQPFPPSPTIPAQEANVPILTPKPWWQSRTIIYIAMTVAIPIVARYIPALGGISPNTATDQILKLLEQFGPIITAILAAKSRIESTQPIAGTAAAQQVEAVVEQARSEPSPYQRMEMDQMRREVEEAPVYQPASLLHMPFAQLVTELPELIQGLGTLNAATKQLEHRVVLGGPPRPPSSDA